MYVCNCSSLTLSGGRIARKGDPVPEADSWPENIKRANLRLGYIKLLEAEPMESLHKGVSVGVALSEKKPIPEVPQVRYCADVKAFDEPKEEEKEPRQEKKIKKRR